VSKQKAFLFLGKGVKMDVKLISGGVLSELYKNEGFKEWWDSLPHEERVSVDRAVREKLEEVLKTLLPFSK